VPDPATWYCKIGEVPRDKLPEDSDEPMRDAVAAAYEEMTGDEPVFLFSGWGAELTDEERAVVENRDPGLAEIPDSVTQADGIYVMATRSGAMWLETWEGQVRTALSSDELTHELSPTTYAFGPFIPVPSPLDTLDVYTRFIEEVDALTINAEDSAVSVVGDLTRAVKRAQLVHEGKLDPVALRGGE
jgi:hypothetical protein